MTESQKILNLAIELSGIVISVTSSLMLFVGPKINRTSQRYTLLYFLGCILLSAANMAGLLMRGLPELGWRAALYFSNYIEFLLPAALVFLITHYLLGIVDPERQRKGLRAWLLTLLAVHVVLLTVSQFTGLYYVIGPDNFYHRQPLYPLSMLFAVLMILSGLVLAFRNRDKLTRKEYSVFLIYYILPAISALLQVIQYGVNLTIFSSIIAGVVMYVFIVSDQTERYARRQKELARQRASINVLQMRPRFICNTMMSIYYLIAQDAEKAQQVTLDFTTYLRNNFTALAKEDAISFTEELEHTRAYLAVVKARFEDKLYVEFDTPVTVFKLPPLTLQPIVENSVKFGVSPGLDPLYLSVATRDSAQGVTIIVEDTGPGYAQPEDSVPHTALENIRERLETMCGGSLEIAPRRDGGTKVLVFIPWKK